MAPLPTFGISQPTGMGIVSDHAVATWPGGATPSTADIIPTKRFDNATSELYQIQHKHRDLPSQSHRGTDEPDVGLMLLSWILMLAAFMIFCVLVLESLRYCSYIKTNCRLWIFSNNAQGREQQQGGRAPGETIELGSVPAGNQSHSENQTTAAAAPTNPNGGPTEHISGDWIVTGANGLSSSSWASSPNGVAPPARAVLTQEVEGGTRTPRIATRTLKRMRGYLPMQ